MSQRVLAVGLAASLVVVSPGPAAYAAVSSGFRASAHHNTGRVLGTVPHIKTGAAFQPTLRLAVGLASQPRLDTIQAVGLSENAVSPLTPVEALAPAAALSLQETARALDSGSAEKGGLLAQLWDRFRGKNSADAVAAIPSGLGTKTKPSLGRPGKKAKPGALKRLAGRLDLSSFDKSEKSYILGQAVFLLAISVYVASLPLLVQALTGDAALSGVARLVHYWAFGAASLFAGRAVSGVPTKRVLVGASVARAALFGAIGVLGLAGGLSWGLFLGLVAVNGLVVSMNHLVDIDTDGASRIFSSDKKIEKAGYVYDFLRFSLLLAVPPLVGLGMDGLDGLFGAGIGASAGFSLFAVLMGVAASIYARRVIVRGEETGSFSLRGAWASLRSSLAGKLGGLRTSLVAAIRPSGWLDMFDRLLWLVPSRNWQVFKVIVANKAILARSTMATLEYFVEDALFMVVLPTFALGVLGAGGLGAGLMLSAVTAGGLIASTFLVSRAQDIQKRRGTYRFLLGLSIAASLAFVPSIALWVLPSLWVALPAVLLMKLLSQPLSSRMRALLQAAINADPAARPRSKEIYSLMTAVETIAAGLGAAAFAWLFLHGGAGSALAGALGAYAPMKLVTLVLAAMGPVYFLGLRWVKGHLQKPRLTTYPADREASAFAKLAANLERMGLEPYRTEKVSQPANTDRPTVAILAPASVYKLAIAQEGGRQSSGDVHLALDPSWLIKVERPEGGHRLLLKKGLYFDKAGRAVLVEYETPREVRYFADYYTLGANDRDDGVALEKDLDVPMSSSVQLEAVTNEKLLTRLILAAKGVAVPATVAFLMAGHPLLPQVAAMQPVPGVQVSGMPAGAAEARKSVTEFLAGYPGAEVVVKPSGARFHSARGVKFFPREDVDGIVAHVLALSTDPLMSADGAVLVDARLTPPALMLNGRKKDWNLRVLAARAPWGGTAATGIFARVGTWGVPTTAEPAKAEDAAEIVRAEEVVAALRAQHGLLKTDEDAARFRAELEKLGEGALLALAEAEASRVLKDGEARSGRTDYIGLDVMVELEDGRLVPKVIEVNDHDAGGQWQLDGFYPERAGAHSREWVATMLQRARRDALKGKRIVVVGAGYSGKRFIFERARELGVKIVLVDKGLTGFAKLVDGLRTSFGGRSRDHWARGLVSEFVAVDTTKPAEALDKARAKLLRSARKNGKLDGLTTYWEDDVPLAADIAAALDLPYHAPAAARAVRSKLETRKIMEEKGLPTPRFAVLKSAEDLEAAMEKVGFPAVLKPVFGAAAMGVKRVDDKASARRAYDEIKAAVNPELDSIFKQGADLVLEQYLDGPENDVDVVMQDGVAVFAEVTDNWPTREPYFLATGSSSPSALPEDHKAQVRELAVDAAKAMGLTDGVLHVEGKYTKDGPRIIEVNGRMGGVYVYDWVKAVWGVDLVEEGLYAAARIPLAAFKAVAPLTYLEGAFLIPKKSGTISRFELNAKSLRNPGLRGLRLMKHEGERISVPPDGFDRAGMLEAQGATREEARRNLNKLSAGLLLHVEKDEQAPSSAP